MTARRRLLALFLIPAVLVLAACAPDHGTVHNKRYSPAYSSTSCHGKPLICYPTYYPASWALDLYTSDGKHGWHGVSEHEYDSVGVGDYFDAKAAHK